MNQASNLVMRGLGLGIYVFLLAVAKDADGRDEPGHDEGGEGAVGGHCFCPTAKSLLPFSPLVLRRGFKSSAKCARA
jgi:hypothetical protein